MSKKGRTRSGGLSTIVKKANPASRYTGLIGTGRLVAESALRAAHDLITGNSGLSGNAAGNIQNRQADVDAAVNQMIDRHNAQTTDSNN